MVDYKVNCHADNRIFVVTDSYNDLYNLFKTLKKEKGRIIHILGAPGTGKSANIYHALMDLNLIIYNVEFGLPVDNFSSKDVFDALFNILRDDLKLESKKDIYRRLSTFDAILIADAFHDSHLQNNETVGFSKWTERVGWRALNFYFRCIVEYINHRKDFKKINLVLQTSWRIYIRGKKYDLFSDLGILSRTLVFLLKQIFTVVEIRYSEDETLKIVKKHLPDADEEFIRSLIKKYGSKPRSIFNTLHKQG
jgi:hypothetical protein